MKAIVLLRTNPGFGQKAYEKIKTCAKDASGVKIHSLVHCFGRFDGVIVSEFSDLKKLNVFTEKLRKDGVFQTETLIAVD
jgi:uncharacterized protein with GYD domain